jgi:hypothetical protein
MSALNGSEKISLRAVPEGIEAFAAQQAGLAKSGIWSGLAAV